MRGFENNVDISESILPHGVQKSLVMEKLAVIDLTLEDDSLLPSPATPDNQHPQPLEIALPLSLAVVKEQQCTNSGGLERDEGIDIPVTPAVEPHIQIVEPCIESALEPIFQRTVLCTMSRSNSARVLGDGQQVKQHGRQLDVPDHEILVELTGAQLNVTELSSRQKRSANASRNLRKSLAWDKAFLSDEGVLDVDELPFVTKTPRKLPKLRPLDIPELLGVASPAPVSVSPAPFSGLDKAISDPKIAVHRETVSSTSGKDSIHSDFHPSDVGNSLNCEAQSLKVRSPSASCKVSTPKRTPSKLDTKSNKADSTRLVPASQVTKADMLKGTRLRLPSTFTGKKEKIDVSPKLVSTTQNDFLRRCKSSSSLLSPYSSASSALSKKVLSVSKKVRDTLGKVLPGGFRASSKSRKVGEDSSTGSHHGSALKALQMGYTLGAIREDLNSPVPTSMARSSSSFLSGSSIETNTNIRKTGLQAEMSDHEVTITEAKTNIKKKGAQAETIICEPTTTDTLGNSTTVPRLKLSSRQKTVALLVGLHGKAGLSFKSGTEKQLSYSPKVSAVSSKKKSGPAASQVPSTEKLNPVSAVQRNTGYSSGLRLPSPKTGFFDMAGPSKVDQTSSLPKRVALDNSYWRSSKHLRPPNPQQGSPPGRSGQPHTDKKRFAAAAASRIARSGIPTAPHLRPYGKHKKGLVPAVSAPNSPHKHHHGLLSPTSYQAVAGSHLLSKKNSSRLHTSNSELTGHAVRSEPSGASRKLKLVCRDGGSDQPLKSMEQREADAQLEVMDMPSNEVSTRHEGEAEFEISGGQKNTSKVVNVSVDSTKSAVETPPLICIELGQLIEKSVSGYRPSFMVEELSPESELLFGTGVIDSILNGEESGSVIDALTTCSIEPTVCNKLPADKLDSYERTANARVGGAQLAGCPDRDVVDRSVGDAAQGRIAGAREKQPEMVNLESESFVHGSTLQSDHRSKCFDYKLVLEDSVMGMAAGNEELFSDISRNIPDAGERKSISAVTFATDEQVQESRKGSHARHLENENVKIRIDDVVDSPSHWSDWPLLEALSKLSHSKTDTKQHDSPVSSLSKRLSGTRTVTPEIIVPNTSLVTASDSQTDKSPLTPNVGLLNATGGCTATPASRKEKNSELVFDHSASEVICAQENIRFSEGRAGSAQPHKPRQQKLYSGLNLDQSEADGTTELSFLFSEERLRALEAFGQESLQMKSGAVQHSPPNKKISPNRNPWSPVKRTGQQLGPFDCTKKHTNANTGQ